MPPTQFLCPLLRPLGARVPRQAHHQFLRFSTATRLREIQKPSSTPQTTPEAPSTSPSPSRAADLAAAEAATDADSAQPPAPKPALPSQHETDAEPKTSTPKKPSVGELVKKARKAKATKSKASSKSKPVVPPLKYHVGRSNNNNLPIYTDYKRGGNLHLTVIRKITGDLNALKEDLVESLNKESDAVTINSVTRSIQIKGHHVAEVSAFLTAKGM
ncbi:unnamed protein product [Periconia digitata]|uniref:Large ribosomal subunit protein mL49 n=1 Tax=Periconia digitata TaxID=1303443 RepID=A0A9W4UMP2_9PLEO|nr:unnamed protein product [Periconia digitata]